MNIRLPLIHIIVPSKIISELIRTYILECCKNTCAFDECHSDDQSNGRKVLVICDWHDFVAGKVTEDALLQDGSALGTVQIHYIVINTVRGEETRLRNSPCFGSLRGLFYVDDDLDIFRKGFTVILKDEMWVQRGVLMTWMNSPRKDTVAILSPREESVLKSMTDGLSNREISRNLSISTNTVKAHVYNIYKKISVSNRLQAAQWASTYFQERTMDNLLSSFGCRIDTFSQQYNQKIKYPEQKLNSKKR